MFGSDNLIYGNKTNIKPPDTKDVESSFYRIYKSFFLFDKAHAQNVTFVRSVNPDLYIGIVTSGLYKLLGSVFKTQLQWTKIFIQVLQLVSFKVKNNNR